VEAIEERTTTQGSISVNQEVGQSAPGVPQPGPSVRSARREPSERIVITVQGGQQAAPAEPVLREGPGRATSATVSRDLDALYPEWCVG
jgi:hypothetical protein